MKVKDIILESYKSIIAKDVIVESNYDDQLRMKEEFDEYLNTIFEPVKMGMDITFSPAFVLKRCDPVRYNIMLTDYIDEQEEE